ncbi:MAG: hypothetical protein ACE5I9_11345 [Candidatus Methylomirabilales bacterium]
MARNWSKRQMQLWLVGTVIAGILCGCAALSPKGIADQAPEGYAYHRVENDELAIHWNILQLTFQALDAEGRVTSETAGAPHRDIFHVGDQGLFRIAMAVTGGERDFLVRADYWWEPFDDSDREDRRSIFHW